MYCVVGRCTVCLVGVMFVRVLYCVVWRCSVWLGGILCVRAAYLW